MQIQVSFPGIDLVNDTITDNNGTSCQMSVIDFVVHNPNFAILPNEAGTQLLCTTCDSVSGYTVSVGGGSPITGVEFDILFPGHFSTHPIRRPQ